MGKSLDLTGARHEMLTGVRLVGKYGHNNLWECVCDCGKICNVPTSQWGRQKSCGCLRTTSRTVEELKDILLNNRIITESGCWEWTKARKEHGYGMTAIGTKPIRVTRVAAHLWLGMPLESKLMVCHKCDNPPCFNPDHLFVGTMADNVHDSMQKGRWKLGEHNRKKTHCPEGHPYTPENTRHSRGRRICRTCMRTKYVYK